MEKEVEVFRNTSSDVSMSDVKDAFHILDADGDEVLSWYEACAGLEDELELMANIWLILIRDGWTFSGTQACLNADIETFYWTNEELCKCGDWREYSMDSSRHRA